MAKHTMGQLRAERDISEMFHRECPRIHSDAFCLRIPATTRLDADKQWVNAQFLARACNTHDDLLKALADLVEIDHRDSLGNHDNTATDEWRDQAWNNARVAIAKAEGKKATP